MHAEAANEGYLPGSSGGETSMALLVLKAPFELIAGFAFGALAGMLVAVPAAHKIGERTHTFAVLAAALVAVFGGKALNLSGAPRYVDARAV